MEPKPFDDMLVSNPPPDAEQNSSELPPHEIPSKAQAVVEILHNRVLSHTFGAEGEYEVRTTLATLQAWRYRSTVLRQGRVIESAFPAIEVDRTRDMQKARIITEEMRIAFAAEAVDTHFSRCAAVKEYVVLASIFSAPPPRSHRPLQATMVVLLCAALAGVYWFWKQPTQTHPTTPAVKALTPTQTEPKTPAVNVPSPMVQWERKEVFYTQPAGQPFTFPLPALNHTSKGAPVDVLLDPSTPRPDWLQFNREALRISGVAPPTREDKTYQLVLLAKANGGRESRLDVYLTIIGQKTPLQAPSPPSPASAPSPTPAEPDGVGMLTGSPATTYHQFGQDIAKVMRSVGVHILVRESGASLDTLRRLGSAENAALGIVQSDVLAFLSRSADPELRRLARRLRVIYPLYHEQVHLFARADIRRFADLGGRRVIIGTQGSGSWLTANNLLRMMNVKPAERLELSPAEGIKAVLTGQADAMFYVVDKPARLFTAVAELQKDARYATLAKDIHFVPLTHAAMLREYAAASIGPQDYAWLGEAVPTVAVKAVLLSVDFSGRKDPSAQKRCAELGKLGLVIRENFTALQRTGHPKWREVDLDQRIGSWKQDTCSQMRPRVPQPKDDLSKAVTDILKNTGQAR